GGEAARCRELAVAGHLTKPVKPSDLWDAIINVLAARRSGGRAPSSGSAATAPRPGPGRLKILVGADNPVDQQLARKILVQRGHTVVVATEGFEAVAAVEKSKETPFDLALMDVQMPRMSGLEASLAIREGEKGSKRRLPIIALTAHAMKGDRERCLADGMDDYLSKPVKASQLLEAVTRLAVKKAKSAGRRVSRGNGKQVLDKGSLLERVEGDRALLNKMIRAFRADAPHTLQEIHRALKQRDAAGLKDGAHALKGSAATLAGMRAAAAAERLEGLARERNFRQTAEAYRPLVKGT